MADRLNVLFADRLHLRRGPLELRVARARRMLPAAVRRDAAYVARAARKAGHPRLEAQVDPQALSAAYDRAVQYLEGPELRQKRSLARLRVVAGMVANLLIVLALLIAVLSWRGFL
ncbi:hypothetical protein SAMN05444340_107168 [Citreimonas salinaria]|uniref:Uncharacterized protein n=2 Tax=Citreimonas salinaria TaxID=321339 RepID=A0A1H3JQJ1_9RHOB|nr:hypothetical protein SAMN05444340_107168 [Citreimonas salinaria]